MSEQKNLQEQSQEPLQGSSVTRTIWGNVPNIILIYLGAAAEFALNPEVDWLFFTGKIPEHPMQRFVITFKYNQMIFFSPKSKIPQLAKHIRDIHSKVEKDRSTEEKKPQKMSNESFKQVLAQLIDYGISGWEYLNHTEMSLALKEEYYQDMKFFAEMMQIQEVEPNYIDFMKNRELGLDNYLIRTKYTDLLYESYQKDIGKLQLFLVKQFQALFLSRVISDKLDLKFSWWFQILYKIYPYIHTDWIFWMYMKFLVNRDVYQELKKFKSYSEA